MSATTLCAAWLVLFPAADDLVPATPKQVRDAISATMANIRSIPGFSIEGTDQYLFPNGWTSRVNFANYGNTYRHVSVSVAAQAPGNAPIRESVFTFDGQRNRTASYVIVENQRRTKELHVDDWAERPAGLLALEMLGFSSMLFEAEAPLFDFLEQRNGKSLDGVIDSKRRVIILKSRWTMDEGGTFTQDVTIELDPPNRILEIATSFTNDRGTSQSTTQTERFGECNGVWFPAEVLRRNSSRGGPRRDAQRVSIQKFSIRDQPHDFSDALALERDPNIKFRNVLTLQSRRGNPSRDLLERLTINLSGPVRRPRPPRRTVPESPSIHVEPGREQTIRRDEGSPPQMTVTFRILNESDKVINITGTSATQRSKVQPIDKTRLEPGAATDVHVDVYSYAELDEEVKVVLETDDPTEKHVELFILVKAPIDRPKLDIYRLQLLSLFGQPPDAKEAVKGFTTLEDWYAPHWLVGARFRGPQGVLECTLRRAPEYDQGPLGRRGYQVVIPLDGKPGRRDGMLELLDRQGAVAAKHPCSYEIRPWLEVLPRSLAGSFAEGSSEPMQRVVILDPKLLKQPDFRVTVAPPTVDWLKHDIKVENGLPRVSVTADVSKLPPGTHETTLVITTNSPKEPAITIPIRVHIRKGEAT